jgi:hypothetical protein
MLAAGGARPSATYMELSFYFEWQLHARSDLSRKSSELSGEL